MRERQNEKLRKIEGYTQKERGKKQERERKTIQKDKRKRGN